MTKFLQGRCFVRHWPLLVTITAWLLLAAVPVLLRSEILRGVVAVASIGLMVYQWLSYRKTIIGSNFLLLSLGVAVVTLASLWLALNVVRYYTYEPENETTWAWHTLVARIQHPLGWTVGVLLIVLFVWALVLFARWFSGKARALTGGP